jgi:hypothetical protein
MIHEFHRHVGSTNSSEAYCGHELMLVGSGFDS